MSGEAGMGREKRGKQTLRKKMMVVMLISAMSSILAVVIVSYMTIRMIRNDSTIGIVYNLGEGNGTVDLKGTTLENMNLEGSLTLKEETVQLKDGKLEDSFP